MQFGIKGILGPPLGVNLVCLFLLLFPLPLVVFRVFVVDCVRVRFLPRYLSFACWLSVVLFSQGVKGQGLHSPGCVSDSCFFSCIDLGAFWLVWGRYIGLASQVITYVTN